MLPQTVVLAVTLIVAESPGAIVPVSGLIVASGKDTASTFHITDFCDDGLFVIVTKHAVFVAQSADVLTSKILPFSLALPKHAVRDNPKQQVSASRAIAR